MATNGPGFAHVLRFEASPPCITSPGVPAASTPCTASLQNISRDDRLTPCGNMLFVCAILRIAKVQTYRRLNVLVAWCELHASRDQGDVLLAPLSQFKCSFLIFIFRHHSRPFCPSYSGNPFSVCVI